jgi:hypothetical protein
MDGCRLDSLKGDIFSWENEAEYSSVVGGAGIADPRQKFKISSYHHKYVHNHTKKTAWKQPGHVTGREYFFLTRVAISVHPTKGGSEARSTSGLAPMVLLTIFGINHNFSRRCLQDPPPWFAPKSR